MSFKQPGASLNGGRLAKAVINLHRPYQVSTAISSLNTVFCINGYVGDVPTKFLLDSGAAISVINSDIVRDKPLNQVNICAVGANGTPLEVAGQTTVTIHLSDFKVDHQFTVVHNLTVDCLLGADFLQHHGAVLDCCNNTLSLGKECKTVIPMDLKRQSSENCFATTANVCSPCDMEIPRRTVMLLDTVLSSSCNAISVMLVEPILNLPNHLRVARSLSRVHDNQVTIQVMNISPSPVKLFKGMKLGVVTPEQNILFVSKEEPDSNLQVSSFDHLDFPNLSSPERTELVNLLTEFSDIFSPSNGLMGHTSLIKHSIPTTGPPIRQPVRRVPEALKNTIKTEVDRMLDQNIIRPSTSPWASPVVMVRKSDGSWRFCVDYRRLNSITHRDAYPLPRIDATLDSLAGCKYFTTLDLASGYWQVALEENDKEKTAFSTPQGHFEFNVMPFGLTNAPATFQRLMECALAGLNNDQCLIYLDDIIIFSSSFLEHLQHLRNTFMALRKAHLQLKLSKCSFAHDEVRYLGHIVSAAGVKPNPCKVDAVSQYPAPTNVKELKQFLGLTNYYRKFIYNYAHTAEPLTKLLRGSKKQFCWTTSCQQAFDTLKSKLLTSPILGYPDFKIPFVLHTDASDTAVGAVLSQFQNDQEIVIAYWSRQLTKAERNYSTIEREALAVVGAVKEFYPYLYGFPFRLLTDHNPLTSLKDLKDVGGRLTRWMLYLQQFHFSFEHWAGKYHANADAMSRVPAVTPVLAILQQLVTDLATVKSAQQADEVLSPLISALTQGQTPPSATCKAPGLKRAFLEDGVLCRTFHSSSSSGGHLQVVIPDILKQTVLQQLHNQSGHLGLQKTLGKLKERYYWPGYEADVATWINECKQCQQRNPPQPTQQAPLESITSDYPFEKLSWDIMGPLPPTTAGNKYIVVVTDLFSKWVEAFPVKATDTETLASLFVNEVVCRYGVPSYLHSDQDANLTSNLMAALCKQLGITQTRTSAYHPQGNGQVERFNRTLESMLAKVASK